MLIDYFSLLYRLLIHLGWWKDDGKRFVLIQDLPAVTIGFNLGADLYHQMDLESWGKHQPLEESFHDGTDCTSLDVQRKERYSPARKCKIQEIRWKVLEVLSFCPVIVSNQRPKFSVPCCLLVHEVWRRRPKERTLLRDPGRLQTVRAKSREKGLRQRSDRKCLFFFLTGLHFFHLLLGLLLLSLLFWSCSFSFHSFPILCLYFHNSFIFSCSFQWSLLL